MNCVVCLLLCLIVLSLSSNTPGRSQVNQNRSGLPLGPETDALFNQVQKRKQQLPPSAPSQEDPFSPADLNRDSQCDRKDIKLFRKVLGKCVRVGSSAMVSEVDFDLDGCVTQKDKQAFLDLWKSCKNSSKAVKQVSSTRFCTTTQLRSTESRSDIRHVDFKNLSYCLECEGDMKVIELRDGSQVSADGARSGLMRITYGDLTGDGSEEAIILMRRQNTRISRTLDEVFVYTLKNGESVALAHFEGGRRGDYILSVESLKSNFKIEDRFLILDQAILREGEDVPTQYYTIKYRWNGIQMVEAERSSLKPILEGMREVG